MKYTLTAIWMLMLLSSVESEIAKIIILISSFLMVLLGLFTGEIK